MKKIVFMFFFGAVLTHNLISQNRIDRPLQVQLNFSGAFLATFGKNMSDSEIQQFTVTNWGLPGISVGYHFNRMVYAGLSFTPSNDITMVEPWGFHRQKDGVITVNYATGTFYTLDFRFSPFRNGLYLAGSFNHIPEVRYDMYFKREAESVIMGNNSYPSDLYVFWNYKKVNTVGFGLGYNAVFKNGVSFNLGILVPAISGSAYEDVVIQPVEENVNINPEDIVLATESLLGETFYYPIQFRISLGYNLQMKL